MSDGRKLRAIDLYSGAGGWSAGLALAGIEVVASYERWEIANRTNRLNNGHPTHTCDIRGLDPQTLPRVDVVVGSPPCTEFSLSNRGGGGNISNGLEDVSTFLRIVDTIRPQFWVMENVPRAASIIAKELKVGGRLSKFSHLEMKTIIVGMDKYGLPQRRKRSLIGNIDFGLLGEYKGHFGTIGLGEVIAALANEIIEDPLFGITLSKDCLTDHSKEAPLDAEETRINEAAKTAHPVYNSMSFPDPLGRPVRTITATCTRVSRESVIIPCSDKAGHYRRLTLRERASLQGFPATYKFYSPSYGGKLRMIGNAVPPAFAYYIGNAIAGRAVGDVPSLRSHAERLNGPSEPAPVTKPRTPAKRFPEDRTFRFSIPNLRLKSGVRFELTNNCNGVHVRWCVGFVFGTSKDIKRVDLNENLLRILHDPLTAKVREAVALRLAALERELAGCDIRRMQAVWSHAGPGGTRPFQVLDFLGDHGALLIDTLTQSSAPCEQAIVNALGAQFGTAAAPLPGVAKLLRHAPLIHAGLLIGSLANASFGRHLSRPRPQRARVVERRRLGG